MNTVYNIYVVRDWSDVRSGPCFPIPLCKAHGEELKQFLKKKWHEPGGGLYVYKGLKTDEDCHFCEGPEGCGEFLIDRLARRYGLEK